MGFYGRVIKEPGLTQFTFDRIYSSLAEARANEKTDGIYSGRFVLVEYTNDIALTGTIENLNEYICIKKDNDILYSKSTIVENDIVRVDDDSVVKIYQCNGYIENDIAIFKLIYSAHDEKEKNIFNLNSNIDKALFDTIRGYDSTVWQKVFLDDDIANEKYVMVAELNAVVPEFHLTPDAPTMNPVPPHFDKESTNTTYWLHSQPNWGFRVKATAGASDEKVDRITANYNKDTGNITYTTDKIDAAIYYNKAGFDSEKQSYDTTQQNSVNITMAKSGNKYNTHGFGQDLQEADDIQEISIILPAIGNSVSKLWDMAYGDNVNAEKKRNKDISWNSTKGNRLVVEDKAGNGFEYKTSNTESIAGCINSVHDLMGMIIDTYNGSTEDLDDNKIYYNPSNKTYNRRFINYEKNVEFVGNGTDTVTNQYKEIGTLLSWEDSKHYIKDAENNYLLAIGKPQRLKQYYDIVMNPINLSNSYSPNDYWYWDENLKSYILDSSSTASAKEYYTISQLKSEQILFYTANTYYVAIESNENGPTKVQLDSEDYDSKKTYYYVAGDYTITNVFDPKTNNVYQILEGGELKEVKNLRKLDSDQYYFKNGNTYTRVTQHNLPKPENKKEPVPTTYYTFTTNKQETFYTSGKYYYQTGENKNDYFKDLDTSFNSDRIYYTLENELPELKFYEPEKYYYKDNNEKYILDKSESIVADRVYYELDKYYVFSDPSGEFAEGSEWNTNYAVPSGVVVATRKEIVTLKEIEGFARDFNTIHGLILRLNQLLCANDANTRDINTVQGAINRLNDLIYRMGDITPNQVLVADKYGRLNGVDIAGLVPNYENETLNITKEDTLGEVLTTIGNTATTSYNRVASYESRVSTLEKDSTKAKQDIIDLQNKDDAIDEELASIHDDIEDVVDKALAAQETADTSISWDDNREDTKHIEDKPFYDKSSGSRQLDKYIWSDNQGLSHIDWPSIIDPNYGTVGEGSNEEDIQAISEYYLIKRYNDTELSDWKEILKNNKISYIVRNADGECFTGANFDINFEDTTNEDVPPNTPESGDSGKVNPTNADGSATYPQQSNRGKGNSLDYFDLGNGKFYFKSKFVFIVPQAMAYSPNANTIVYIDVPGIYFRKVENEYECVSMRFSDYDPFDSAHVLESKYLPESLKRTSCSVGAIVCTDTNEKPSSIGEWKLIDKEFAPYKNSASTSASLEGGAVEDMENGKILGYDEIFGNDTVAFTPFNPNSNTKGFTCIVRRAGHIIDVYLRINLGSKILSGNDHEKKWGTLNETALGLTGMPDTKYGIVGMSPTVGFATMWKIHKDIDNNELSVKSLRATGSTDIDSGNHFYFTFSYVMTDINLMRDEACNKFYWKRIK